MGPVSSEGSPQPEKIKGETVPSVFRPLAWEEKDAKQRAKGKVVKSRGRSNHPDADRTRLVYM